MPFRACRWGCRREKQFQPLKSLLQPFRIRRTEYLTLWVSNSFQSRKRCRDTQGSVGCACKIYVQYTASNTWTLSCNTWATSCNTWTMSCNTWVLRNVESLFQHAQPGWHTDQRWACTVLSADPHRGRIYYLFTVYYDQINVMC